MRAILSPTILILILKNFQTGGAGYIILISSRNAALSYFAVYMATWFVVSCCNYLYIFNHITAVFILSFVRICLYQLAPELKFLSSFQPTRCPSNAVLSPIGLDSFLSVVLGYPIMWRDHTSAVYRWRWSLACACCPQLLDSESYIIRIAGILMAPSAPTS